MPGRSAAAVAAILREEILSGQRPRHSKLPTQQELALKLDASEGTVQRAIQDLRREGLVAAARGKGTVVTYTQRLVRDERTRYLKAQREQDRGSWAAELVRQGLQPDVKTTVTHVVPPEHVRVLLGTAEGEEVLVRGREMFDRSGEAPVLLQVAPSYIPGDIAFGTPLENTAQPRGGMLTTLEELGHAEVRAYNRLIPARPPTEEEAVMFGIRSDQVLFEMWHVAAEASGRVVEVSHHVGPAHLVEFIYPVPMV